MICWDLCASSFLFFSSDTPYAQETVTPKSQSERSIYHLSPTFALETTSQSGTLSQMWQVRPFRLASRSVGSSLRLRSLQTHR